MNIESPSLDTHCEQSLLTSFSDSIRSVVESLRDQIFFEKNNTLYDLKEQYEAALLRTEFDVALRHLQVLAQHVEEYPELSAYLAKGKAGLYVIKRASHELDIAAQLMHETIDHLLSCEDRKERQRAELIMFQYLQDTGEFHYMTQYLCARAESEAHNVRNTRFHRGEALKHLYYSLEKLALSAEKSGHFEVAITALRKKMALSQVVPKFSADREFDLFRLATLADIQGQSQRSQVYRDKLTEKIAKIETLPAHHLLDYALLLPDAEKELVRKMLLANPMILRTAAHEKKSFAFSYRLATAFSRIGRLEDAEELLGELCQLCGSCFREDPLSQDKFLAKLCDFYHRTASYPQLEYHLKMRLNNLSYSKDVQPQKISLIQQSLARTYNIQSKYNKALPLQRSIVAEKRSHVPGSMADLLSELAILADLEERCGNYEESEKLCREALSHYEQETNFPYRKRKMSILQGILIRTLRHQGRDAEASEIPAESLYELIEVGKKGALIAQELEYSFKNNRRSELEEALSLAKEKYGDKYESSAIDDHLRGVFLLTEAKLFSEVMVPHERKEYIQDALHLMRQTSTYYDVYVIDAMNHLYQELTVLSDSVGIDAEVQQGYSDLLADLRAIEIEMEDTEATDTYAYAMTLLLQSFIFDKLDDYDSSIELRERSDEAARKAKVQFGID